MAKVSFVTVKVQVVGVVVSHVTPFHPESFVDPGGNFTTVKSTCVPLGTCWAHVV